MKKDNKQSVIAKNKKRTKILCYISLVVLVILLFLPVALRLFVRERIEVKPETVIVLNCNKTDETINSTFLNDEPQNLMYIVKGDKTVIVNPDEEMQLGENDSLEGSTTITSNTPTPTPESTSGNASLFDILKPFSAVNYDNSKNQTTVRTAISDLKGYGYYQSEFSTLEKQMATFAKYGFSCTQTVLANN